MSDIKARMSQRIQLTTDQLSIYLKAVDHAFGVDVDYAMLQKIYAGGGDGRYSPAECIGCKKVEVTGTPSAMASMHGTTTGDPAPPPATSATARADAAPHLKVSSVRMLASDCAQK